MIMLMPTVFGQNLFDELFDTRDFSRAMRNVEKNLYGHNAKNEMKTDVKENEEDYEIFVDLPGFKKENLQLKLEDGYLTITAEKSLEKDEQEKDTGKYLRQERYYGSMQRSFFVGEQIKTEDVKAGFNDGVLNIRIPKKPQIEVKDNHFIMIED